MKSTLTDEEVIRIYFPIQPSSCFEILYRRYHQTIYHQCRQLTQNAEQAQDFSQDIFIKVFLKLGSFQERSRFPIARRPGWFYSVAYNYCQDQLRLGRRFSTIAMNEYPEVPLINITESLIYEEVMHRFGIALASLSYSEQLLLRLKYVQDLSLKELANQSGLSISALKMRLKRSRAKMEQRYARQRAG